MSIEQKAAAFLTQKRIAVVGVSRKPGTGNGILKSLQGRGYEVFAVNPLATEIDGQPCYPTVQEIPGGVEAAVIVTRPEVTEAVVADCLKAGITHVWMHYNALFGRGNSSVNEAAVAQCQAQGINVIPGGCPLMFGSGADIGHRCMRWVLDKSGKLP